ncbi:arginase [Oscillospiraceae bacterium OttesenSCG-928-G22]|nr:arginase [Oscillospiraceae bacterium OttesenSCG-928-G22]
MKRDKTLSVIGVQLDEGACRRGVDMGPSAIRYAGLPSMLSDLGYKVVDWGDVVCDVLSDEAMEAAVSYIPAKKRKNLNSVFAVNNINTKLYHRVRDVLEEGHFPIIIGGDHALAAGSITAVQSIYRNVGVIWVDAHGDFNDADISLTGNMHGMPLSAVTGFGPDEMLPFKEEEAPYIDPKKVALIGARLLDEEEKKKLRKSGVTVFTTADIDKLGMAEVMRRAIDIAGTGTSGIHVSYDLDGIDPSSAIGVGTPVNGGITYREAHLIAELLYESGKLVSLEVVELNPILDRRNQTGEIAAELVASLMGKTIY